MVLISDVGKKRLKPGMKIRNITTGTTADLKPDSKDSRKLEHAAKHSIAVVRRHKNERVHYYAWWSIFNTELL
ncbi:MAG: hypothetical protein A2648_00455 [Candidatus Lloydbacteria bacterium RIFCSPHIGHO2_01_FULL_41_20]|uniref:Uncharacterized protein n=1 Tax=Candidatus Lloydbacteria bacterium RIFCSPHIGHO2_01_FULL_41_20 TaxID=1798657 RepID=A0A1G2CSA9_9BACT|nr:MAG: hypothetical protein A2648_00455 [Candidatus Lloydbacteria bacterium RIFCSPHIGHO2_01_FULL_41_20]